MQKKEIRVNLKEDSAEKIREALSLCYVNARGRDGRPYQKASLLGLRAAMHRHIQSLRSDLNIYSDSEFALANKILDGRLKELKRTGESKPAQHKAVINNEDMKKIVRYFSDLSSPVTFTEDSSKVFFLYILFQSFRNVTISI